LGLKKNIKKIFKKFEERILKQNFALEKICKYLKLIVLEKYPEKIV